MTKISALSSGAPGSTSLLVAVVNSATVKITVADIAAGLSSMSSGVALSSGAMWYGDSSGKVAQLAPVASGAFLVYSTITGSTGPRWSSVISINSSGEVNIGQPVPAAITTADLNIIGSSTASGGRGLVIVNQVPSGPTAGAGNLMYSHDDAALAAGDRLGFLVWGGYDGAAAKNTGALEMFASENWTTAAAGTYMRVALAADLTSSRTERLRVASSLVSFATSAIQISIPGTPTSAAAGVTGEIRWDTSYVYVCTSTGPSVWKRAALSSF